MAHFAQLNENNIVIQIIVVSNQDTSTKDGVENENIGIGFCKSLFGEDTNWKQTSYNATFRKNYAGIGYTFDAARDAFIPLKPYNSWVLNELTCQWQAPVAMPTDGQMYSWNEDTVNWMQEEMPIDTDYEVN